MGFRPGGDGHRDVPREPECDHLLVARQDRDGPRWGERARALSVRRVKLQTQQLQQFVCPNLAVPVHSEWLRDVVQAAVARSPLAPPLLQVWELTPGEDEPGYARKCLTGHNQAVQDVPGERF